jgi:hypothetical protein
MQPETNNWFQHPRMNDPFCARKVTVIVPCSRQKAEDKLPLYSVDPEDIQRMCQSTEDYGHAATLQTIMESDRMNNLFCEPEYLPGRQQIRKLKTDDKNCKANCM